jgi:flagellar hook-length control protein FliK
MDDSLNAQPLTCSARPGLQARAVSQADERSIALQGNTVTQARGSAARNPCCTMPSETPAAPPTLSQEERGEQT